ncbi:SIR2-domain-containing protein [Choiromyces venosus 120613-1]|uniref:SIR2-domain-containing protein n=1 Tax=Choiromyces venosus 120613-1 TaxID=1336337 RepID=A0A3N4JMD5_9PEZI|nr:SIR2-domain-containing protein [Choiromyces venosus 120613-1]
MATIPIAGAPNGAELPAHAAESDEEEVLPIGGIEDELFEQEDEEDNEDEESGADEGEEWDVSSVFDEWLAQSTDPVVFGPEEDAVTAEEGRNLRDLLRRVGEARFIDETLHTGTYTAKKLLTAFGVRPPFFLEGSPDMAYLPFLGLVVTRDLRARQKLTEYNTLDDVVKLLKESSNIIVLTGAGISTSLGIPDFRSKGSGLYSRLEGLGLSDPQEVFDLDVFREDPTIFYSIAGRIIPTIDQISPTHAFIELLQRKNKLLTQYTQNIDNLEIKAGINPEKLIQCHGSFASASCVQCGHKVPGETIFPEMLKGIVPECEACLNRNANNGTSNNKVGKKRKRSKGSGSEKTSGDYRRKRYDESSDDDGGDDIPQAGVMKPDIIFFGEQLPATFNKRLVDHDRSRCDLFICIGTSLKVAPVSEIIGILPPHIPQIYISKTPVTHVNFDIELIGSCDDVVAELSRRAEWDLKHEMIPEDHDRIVKVELEEGTVSRWIFERHGEEKKSVAEEEGAGEE